MDSNGRNKLEDAKISCVNGECPLCGFDKIWSKGIHRHILLHEYDNTKGEFVEKRNQNSVWAIDIFGLKQLIGAPTRTKKLRMLLRMPEKLLDKLLFLDLQTPMTVSTTNRNRVTARNLVLETFRGTIIDYLDHLESQLSTHISHRNLVCSEHRCKKDFERNSRPWTISGDIDFSENGSIENYDKVQSEHWAAGSNQYTLFMFMISFLLVDEWNKTDGDLAIGQEVTVDGEIYIRDADNPNHRPDINLSSY